MDNVSTIGIDIAKNVFQIHGIDYADEVVVCRRLKRSQVRKLFKRLPACLVGMEARATSHYWARELSKLGHDIKLMPPRYVKPYVKRNKYDAANHETKLSQQSRLLLKMHKLKFHSPILH